MCGIFGIVSQKIQLSENQKKNILISLSNRGPNNKGYYSDNGNFEFLHTRLSIQDLSSDANQPMISRNKRFMIVFNGEIFNHLELRKKYFKEFDRFKTYSDTETLLEMISELGFENTLSEIKGQYAFAIWDFNLKKIFIVVDRLSEKPLYYNLLNDYLVFSSDLHPFQYLNFVEKKVSKTGLSQLLKFNYIPHPHSIYENTFKVEPGSYLEFKLENKKIHLIKKEKYWDINKIFLKDKKEEKNQNFYIDQFEKNLNKSVKDQLISDIPIGCFLSGGLDSSLIAIMMSQNYEKKLKTFSIGFDDSSFDETKYADEIATMIGSDHKKKIFNKKNLIEKIQKMTEIYSEPFGDSSALPTALVAEFAKENEINVVLTGDGGDEFLGGYQRYLWTEKLEKKKINKKLLKIIKTLVEKIGSKNINSTHQKLKNIIPNSYNTPDIYSKIIKVIKILSTNSSKNSYNYLVTNEKYKEIINFEDNNLNNNLDYYFEDKIFDNLDLKKKMMLYDINNYLSGDILVKVDRACMQYSVESRSPFLDKDLIEFGCGLPDNLKFSKNSGKIIIKKILLKYCGEKFINRPKMGFGIPLSSFLREDLKDWIFDLLHSQKIKENDLIDIEKFKKIYENHCIGLDNKEIIWSTISYLSWLYSN